MHVYRNNIIKLHKTICISSRFIKLALNHLITHDCLKSAAALSFTTILSIVPLVALLLFSASTFINASENQLLIQSSLLHFFSPTIGEELYTKLIMLAEQASKLRTLGLSALIVTVLLGLNTIDLTINRI